MNEHVKKEELEIDFWELAHFLWKKIGWILFCMILGAGLAGIVTKFVITPKYEASSMIYILGKTKSIDEGINLQLSKQLTVDFSVLAKSRPVMEQVIHTLDLDISYEKLEKMVRVENPENSSILKLTVISENPKFAKKVANALANATADQVAKVMVTEKPSMAEKAVMPIEPTSPSLIKNIAIGGIMGIVIVVAILTILFLLDDTIKSEDDIRRYMGIDVLAVIPDRAEKGREKRSRNHT